MIAGGDKTKVVFEDRTKHGIPDEEQAVLIQKAPKGTTKMVAYEEGEGDGHRLRLEILQTGKKPLVCSVVGTSCVDALDKLRTCLERK